MGSIKARMEKALEPLVKQRVVQLERNIEHQAMIEKLRAVFAKRKRLATGALSVVLVFACLMGSASLVSAAPSETDYPKYVVDNANYQGEVVVPESELAAAPSPASAPSYTPPPSSTPPAPNVSSSSPAQESTPTPTPTQTPTPISLPKLTLDFQPTYAPVLKAYDRGCRYDPYVINYYDMMNAGWDPEKAAANVMARVGYAPPAPLTVKIPPPSTSSTISFSTSPTSPPPLGIGSAIVSLTTSIINALLPLILF